MRTRDDHIDLQISGFFQYGFHGCALYQQSRCIKPPGSPSAGYGLYGGVLLEKFFSDGITFILRTHVVTDESRLRIRYMNKPYPRCKRCGNVPGFLDDGTGAV